MVKIAEFFELKPEERIHKVVRRHAITLLPELFLAGLLIALPFFFLFALAKWQTAGMILFSVCEAIGILIAIRAFVYWNATVFIVTSHRVCLVLPSGFRKRLFSETPLGFIRESSWGREGFLDALWRVGTIRIKASDSDPGMAVSAVPGAEKIHGLINELMEKRGWLVTVGARQEKEDLLLRIATRLDRADEKTLRAVEDLLDRTAA